MSNTFDRTVLEKAKKKMTAIRNKRAEELAKIKEELDKASAEIEAQTKAIAAATESMDVKAYSAAKSKKATAENAAEMYSRRYETIRANEMISEEDSDAWIQELLCYEDELAKQYNEKVLALISEMNDITREYKAIIKDTEGALFTWTKRVHANYRVYSPGCSKKNAKRWDNKKDVHSIQYVGCPLSNHFDQQIRPVLKTDWGC